MKTKEKLQNIAVYAVIVFMLVFLVVSQVYTRREREKVIGIHIKGEVRHPGYYELKNGKRLNDALKLAGGETENANLDAVNLAQPLFDGEEIIIPAIGEETAQDSVYDTGYYSNGYSKYEEGSEQDLAESNAADTNEIININTADMYLLCRLDGIGEATAQRIMDYRKENGGFKTIDELKKVKGIGESKFEKIKENITV